MAIRWPKVTVVIVNYNGKKYLKRCFDSLAKLNYPKNRLKIIMVDNCSADGSIELMKKRYPKIKIISNDINNYCKANNLGIKNSRTEFIAFINNDVRVNKNWLVELIKVITQDEIIGAVGSMILGKDRKVQNAGHYLLPNFYWGERGAGKESSNYSKVEEVPSLCGAAILYRRAGFEKVGLFDEDFVIYGEDVDMSTRLGKAGYRLVFVPKSIVYHTFHGSGNEELSRFYIERNRLLFLAKHHPHKLSNSLFGSGYFSASHDTASSGKLYSLIPELLAKLIKHHPMEYVKNIVNEIVEELKGISHHECNILQERINLKSKEYAQLLADLNNQDKDLFELKEELSNLSEQLRQRMDECLIKGGQLIEKEIQIKNIKGEVKGLTEQVFRNTQEINAKDAKILGKEGELKDLHRRFCALNTEFTQKENELSNLSEQLRNRMDEILVKDGQISAMDSQLIEKDSQISSLSGELTGLKEELGNLSEQLRLRMDEVLVKDGEILERETCITGLNQQIQEHLNSLQAKESLLTEREKELDSLKSELSNLSEQLRQRMDEVLVKDGEILKKDTCITGLNQQIQQHLNSLQAKDSLLTEREEELANLKSELSHLSEQLRQRMDEILLKEGEIIRLKDELNGIYNSCGFRFVLRPLWTVISHTRRFLKVAKRKLFSFAKAMETLVLLRRNYSEGEYSCEARPIVPLVLRSRINPVFWLVVTVMLSPIFLLLSLSFLLEYISWVILKPLLLKKLSPRREIKSIKDSQISLVMPNYNGLDCLRECLPSIFAIEGFGDGQHEVLVVDDGSTDGSVDFIRKNFPQVRLIQNRRNQGFGFTCNRGVHAAKNELIVLINNDIILTKDFLNPLIKHLQKEDTFAATPKLYAWDRKTFIWGMHMGHFQDGYIRLWNEAETGNADKISQPSPSIFAIGGAMVFRKSDFLWLGGFDSIYRPNCWEDIDLSYRAWKRGLRVLYEPKSLVYHKARATLTYERPKEIKNELLFTWKNITDHGILKNHLNLLPQNLYRNRMNFLRGFFWALNYLPLALLHRFLDRRYIKTQDKKIFNQCLLYYRNFMRRGFCHLQDNEKKNVLLITPFMPYPLNVGGKIRIYTLAKLLKDKFDISLLTLINHKTELNYIPELKKVFQEVYALYPKTEIKSNLYPQRYKFSHSHTLIDKLKQLQKNQPIDLVQIESNELLYLIDYIKYIPIIYTEHDSSVMFFQNSYYSTRVGHLLSNFFDYLKRVRFHHLAYKKLDRVILLSEEDEQILQPFFPRSNFVLIPTGVDFGHFSFVHPDRPKLKRLIYVGHYLHHPNEDAVIYFINKIFPRIRRKIPEVEFLIVGSSPTENLKRLSTQPNIRLIPDVKDVYPYLRESTIFVNPIRISAGIKGKVLEAMATGLPVVSTKVGASGICAQNGEQILLADTPFTFAKAVIKLLQDEVLYSKLCLNARRLVEEKYDWRKISSSLIQVYDQALNFLPASPIQEEDSGDKIINLTNQIVEEAVKQGGIRSGFEYGPEELHIELSYRCDSRCIMCDLWDYQQRFSEDKKEITLDEIRHCVEESEHLKKIKTVVLSGGEPFLRQDLVEICGYFIQQFPNISLGILTNGLAPETIIEKTRQILDKYRPKYLWLGSSLDGIGEVHDRIRARNGAFACLEKTIRACKQEDINITLTFTLTTYNFDQLIPAKRFADSYGLEFYIQFAVPKEVREKSVFDFTPSQLSKIEADINKIIQAEVQDRDYQHLAEAFRNAPSPGGLAAKLYYLSHLVSYQKNPKRYFQRCIAGTRFAMLSPFGDLYFCPGLKNGSIGNIREEKFDNLWTSKKAENIREFIGGELCHCWLVCVVFPVIDEVGTRLRGDKEEEKLISLKTPESKPKIISFPEENQHFLEENTRLNEKEYQLGEVTLRSTPRGIGIGAHGRCNADCIFCLGGYPRLFDLKTYQQFFEKRLVQVLPKAEFINLCGFGELLLMPHCEEFLDYLNQTLIPNNKILTTNGIPLSKSINQRLTEGRYSVQISLHASEERLHRILTHTEAFDRIIAQMQNLLSMRRNQRSPSVNLIFIINTFNIENLPDFVEFAAKLGVDSVSANYMTVYTPAHLKLSCFFKQKITNRMFQEAQEQAAKFGLSLNLPPRFGGNGSDYPRCAEPWQYLYVEAEGSILPCCYAGAHIGYLYRDDFQEVWNGDFYKNLRKSLREGNGSGWCKYCYKNRPSNVNDIRAHVSFRPDLQQKILKGFNLK